MTFSQQREREVTSTPDIVVAGAGPLLLNKMLSHSTYQLSYQGDLDTGALSPSVTEKHGATPGSGQSRSVSVPS
ncbi:MAG: hypothetical protein HY700_01055 [Gemmatimonadetes bacterium]|nr:hypothetical protein [Gemmatimonadota bacterium]